MVIHMSVIPLNLQKQIADKMDFVDFYTFQESSKLALCIGAIAKATLDIMEIQISSKGVIFKTNDEWTYGSGITEKTCTLSTAKLHASCPRFSSSNILIAKNEPLTTEIIMEIISDVEKGYYGGKETTLTFSSLSTMNPEVFKRLIEVLSVSKVKSENMDATLFPALEKVREIELDSIEDENLLDLSLPNIKVKTNSTIVNSTLNVILKQWYFNNRKISTFYLINEADWVSMRKEEIFSDLPYSHLWSPSTHKFSGVPALTPMMLYVFRDCNCFELRRGSKSLFISMYSNRIYVKEVSDAKEELMSKFKLKFPAKAFERCELCNMSICRCFFGQ